MRLRPLSRVALALIVAAPASLAGAQDSPPEISHQPAHCTLPDRPVSVCAEITDDGEIKTARVYFRAVGEDFFSYVEMTAEGSHYCATIPAPRRMKALEYYLHAIDGTYEPNRTLPFQLELQDESLCGFPPVENDPSRAAAITVYATNRRQGDALSDRFDRTGVTFVPRR